MTLLQAAYLVARCANHVLWSLGVVYIIAADIVLRRHHT